MSKTIIIIVVVLVIIGGGIFFFMNNGDEDTTNTTTNTNETTEVVTNTEPPKPATEITGTGFNNLVITIGPSVDDVISGEVTLTLSNIPEGASAGSFAMVAPGEEVDSANLGVDPTASDGLTFTLDTTEYENGMYDISGFAITDGDSPPLATATAQATIVN